MILQFSCFYWGFEFFVVDILVARGYGFPLKFFDCWFFKFPLLNRKESRGREQKEWKEPDDPLFNIFAVVRKASDMSLQALEISEPNNLLVTSTVFFNISLYNLLEKDVLSVLFVIMTSKMMRMITDTLRFQIELATHWWFHLLVLIFFIKHTRSIDTTTKSTLGLLTAMIQVFIKPWHLLTDRTVDCRHSWRPCKFLNTMY